MEPERFTNPWGPYGPRREPRWVHEAEGFRVTERPTCNCPKDMIPVLQPPKFDASKALQTVICPKDMMEALQPDRCLMC